MRYFPLHIDLQSKDVLVVGGGEIARRKIDLLLKAGASITVVAPQIDEAVKALLTDSQHKLISTGYHPDQIQSQRLIVAATNDLQVNQLVSNDAQKKNILVNVVDAPELCTATFPAIIDRDPLVVSVGSAGGAPVLTRHVRELIEQTLPQRLAELAKYFRSRRDRQKETFKDIDVRRRLTEQFMTSPGAELAMSGDQQAADKYLFEEKEIATGEVYLVGAGPGDPDLLTLRALQLMQKADVVLHDNLVSPGVLDRVRRDADREFVGKRSGYKSTSQEDINDLLVRLASEGKRVLRLKGGDPFVFGRGGEEIARLIEQGIPFQVVPGITAASGCAAYAGIPLTHRDLAHSVRFITGHPKDGEVVLPFDEFTHELETLVFYMGLGGLGSICQQLMAVGRSPDTPVGIVSKGTTPEQQVLRGTLEDITGKVARAQIQSPTIIFVGQVVNFSR